MEIYLPPYFLNSMQKGHPFVSESNQKKRTIDKRPPNVGK